MTSTATLRYSVRRSKRAKHVRIRVTAADGVVVVVPNRFDDSLLPGLVEQQYAWIDRQLRGLGEALVTTERLAALPSTVRLAACDEDWLPKYRSTDSGQVRIAEAGSGRLVIRGDVDNRAKVRAALKRWLARRAKTTLVTRLDELSAQYRLPYARATIRFQRSRWGSCSSTGTISLNARLMFLRSELVRCVLAHELCHTAHLNHGPRFWSLLDELEPAHRALHVDLKNSWSEIPAWTFA
ncbi:MAG: M48 family metallopeptidase [Gammaproteobacteria bacterium]|nr:M48 family metallopeptidase [Gammaproteobacteria bacterium]